MKTALSSALSNLCTLSKTTVPLQYPKIPTWLNVLDDDEEDPRTRGGIILEGHDRLHIGVTAVVDEARLVAEERRKR